MTKTKLANRPSTNNKQEKTLSSILLTILIWSCFPKSNYQRTKTKYYIHNKQQDTVFDESEYVHIHLNISDGGRCITENIDESVETTT
jgi:hypothetical protein